MTALDLLLVAIPWGVVLHQWRSQRGRPVEAVRPIRSSSDGALPLVSIVVPARNEQDGIERCIRSLLAQDYPRFEIIAVDDCSEDATGEILDGLAAADRRLRVVHGDPLPSGWMGKAHAVVQGYRVARGDWLLFTDADTEHAPWLLSGVMARVRDSPASLATVIGSQRRPSRAISLAQLAVFTCLFLVSGHRAFGDPRSRRTLVNGQFVMLSREAYESIGTHAAVRGYSSTDVSLGYLAKLQGWVPILLNGRDGLTTTMYRTFRQAFQGWSRAMVNVAWTALGPALGSLALLGAIAGMAFLWVVPWVFILRGLVERQPILLGGGGLQLLAAVSLMRLLRGGWGSAARATLAMPASCLLLVAMGVSGLARAWARGGTVWKGRLVHTSARLPHWEPQAPRARRQY